MPATAEEPFPGVDGEIDDPIDDDELTALALAADPDAPVAHDAVCLAHLVDSGEAALLPGWYMPPTSGPSRLLRGWRRRLSLLIVASFILINLYGLCSTYGQVVPA
ncbi:MAG: hypothetical protein ACRD1K_21195 [Acidimicrobiales bacterium]